MQEVSGSIPLTSTTIHRSRFAVLPQHAVPIV
jgi:hypothetical protein